VSELYIPEAIINIKLRNIRVESTGIGFSLSIFSAIVLLAVAVRGLLIEPLTLTDNYEAI
jgi:hypothetical protein